MTSLLMNRKRLDFDHLRPWLYGVPTFLVMAIFLLWSLARLASWIFATIDMTK